MRSWGIGSSIEFIKNTTGKARMYIRASVRAKNDKTGCFFIHLINFKAPSIE